MVATIRFCGALTAMAIIAAVIVVPLQLGRGTAAASATDSLKVVPVQPPTSTDLTVSNEIIVRFKRGADEKKIERVRRKHRLKRRTRIDKMPEFRCPASQL